MAAVLPSARAWRRTTSAPLHMYKRQLRTSTIILGLGVGVPARARRYRCVGEHRSCLSSSRRHKRCEGVFIDEVLLLIVQRR